MALNQADLQIIQTVFGITSEELSGALSSDKEVSLGLRLNGRILSQEEESSLKDRAIDAGIEIGYKKVAEAAGLELSAGEKDPSIIANKLKSFDPSELESAKQNSSEWEQRYNKLNETYNQKNGELENLAEEYSALKNNIFQNKINNTILESLPDKMKIDKRDALDIIKSRFKVEETENGLITKRDNKIVTNPVGTPETIENWVKDYVEERKWISNNGMNGGDVNNINNRQKLSPEQAEKAVIEKGINPSSPEGLKMFNELIR